MQEASTNTTILVVEDNPDHVGLIEAVISRGLRGARVQAALRGQGARRHLRGEWSACEDDGRNNPVPDLIVLDLSLPDGSGFDVLRWIARRDKLKDIPVIVFTASEDPEHARLAEEFGVRRFLQKPAEFGDLVEAIKEELSGANAYDPAGSTSSPATPQVPPHPELI
jgi:DNA-binding response OmpR family regulator